MQRFTSNSLGQTDKNCFKKSSLATITTVSLYSIIISFCLLLIWKYFHLWFVKNWFFSNFSKIFFFIFFFVFCFLSTNWLKNSVNIYIFIFLLFILLKMHKYLCTLWWCLAWYERTVVKMQQKWKDKNCFLLKIN